MLRTIRRVDWLQLLFVQNRWLAVLAAVSLSILVGLAGGWLVAAAGPFMTAALVVGVAAEHDTPPETPGPGAAGGEDDQSAPAEHDERGHAPPSTTQDPTAVEEAGHG